jgi:hypothetical protein
VSSVVVTGRRFRFTLQKKQNYEHNARETARRAHHDAFGNDRGAPWRDPTEGGG